MGTQDQHIDATGLELPALPSALRLANALGRGLDSIGLSPIDLSRDALLRAARDRTGLTDFGDDDFLLGLDRLLASLRTEARTTLLGKLVARGDLLNQLVARLQVVDWRKRHPHVAREEIRKPLFINGLPRTGTTLLQRLLAVDPANRCPLSWEVDSPVPPATPETFGSDPRIPAVQRKLARFLGLAPGLEAAHPLGATLPQECVVIFARNFRSEQFATMFDVPSYVRWIDECSFASTYAWHKQYLQHLQSGGVRGERWLLKSPCHLHLLDDLLTTYPDAQIIHTHRNPIEVCASVSSLFAQLRGISSNAIDREHIGRQQLDWWERLVARALEQRQRHAHRASQFVDVKMTELMAKPIETVERIYAHFGFELKDQVRNEMLSFVRQHPRDALGEHRYRASDFGIHEAREAGRFAAYCQYFDV